MGGYSTSATLLGSIQVLWQEKMQAVALVLVIQGLVLPQIQVAQVVVAIQLLLETEFQAELIWAVAGALVLEALVRVALEVLV